jgi:hypothetical protein
LKSLTLLLIFSPIIIFARESELRIQNDSFYFFTSNVIYVPIEASKIEAKNGVTKYLNNDYLQLDIGVSFDLIGLKAKRNTFSFGIDFFTFSNLRSEDNFKFPVDAIDYMFGVNFNLKKSLSEKNVLTSRLRVSLISSHLEDGHIYPVTDTIFTPYVYSKEFLNLAVMSEYSVNRSLSLKSMLAVDYVFSAIPSEISSFSAQFGIELRQYITKIVGVYVSNEVNLANVNSTTNLNESFEAGIAIGKPYSRSVNFYFDYYDGQDYRGQYYGGYFNYKGLGIRFKF